MMADISPSVLVIAGSDSSGGAGLQRDLRVLADFGVRAVTALTAVTAQSDHEVTSVLVLPPDIIWDQIKTALRTCSVDAVKIGMLGNAATVEAVADCLGELQGVPIILDPVLMSSSGSLLLDEGGQWAMRSRLFPIITLLTPNIPEAAALLGDDEADSEERMLDQAHRLLNFGPQAVLLKGGHGKGEQSIDLLLEKGMKAIRLAAPRIAVTMRGTGCALSSAIGAAMANKQSLMGSCQVAKAYVLGQMQTGLIQTKCDYTETPRQF